MNKQDPQETLGELIARSRGRLADRKRTVSQQPPEETYEQRQRRLQHEQYDQLCKQYPHVWCTAIGDYVFHPRRLAAMCRHAGGRSFLQLCELVGQTAEVELSEVEWYDGIREHRYYWTTRVTIREFQGAVEVCIYNDEGYDVGIDLHPAFEAEDEFGHTYTILTEDLKDIRPI